MVACAQAEEERLASAQLASDEKQRLGRLGVAAEAAQPLPTQNGEEDSLSINNSILQVNPLGCSSTSISTPILAFTHLYTASVIASCHAAFPQPLVLVN